MVPPGECCIEDCFFDFLNKFNLILSYSRIHVADGFCQDQTCSIMFERGTKVTPVFFPSHDQCLRSFPPGRFYSMMIGVPL